jgi:hypothetical protein
LGNNPERMNQLDPWRSGQPTALPKTEHDLGILFIHGIGQHSRGDTLVRFGEPLLDCVRRWVDGTRPTKNQTEEHSYARLSRTLGKPRSLRDMARVDGRHNLLRTEPDAPCWPRLVRTIRQAALEGFQ